MTPKFWSQGTQSGYLGSVFKDQVGVKFFYINSWSFDGHRAFLDQWHGLGIQKHFQPCAGYVMTTLPCFICLLQDPVNQTFRVI